MKLTKKQLRNQKREVTQREIDKIKQQSTDKAVKIITLFPLLALRDEYGFGKVRMMRFVEKLNSIQEAYNEGLLSLEDIQKTIKDETGIEVDV